MFFILPSRSQASREADGRRAALPPAECQTQPKSVARWCFQLQPRLHTRLCPSSAAEISPTGTRVSEAMPAPSPPPHEIRTRAEAGTFTRNSETCGAALVQKKQRGWITRTNAFITHRVAWKRLSNSGTCTSVRHPNPNIPTLSVTFAGTKPPTGVSVPVRRGQVRAKVLRAALPPSWSLQTTGAAPRRNLYIKNYYGGIKTV